MSKHFWIRRLMFLAFVLTLSLSPVANAEPHFTMEVNKFYFQNDDIVLTATIRNLGDTYATVTGVDINKMVFTPFAPSNFKKGISMASTVNFRNMSVYIPAGGAVSNLSFKMRSMINFDANTKEEIQKKMTCTTECTFYWQ